MKKWLIAIGVLTILVLGLFSAKGTVQVSADGEHTHCICGTGNLNVGDHTAHTSVTWTAWTETGRLPNYSDLQVGENYFYLANNVSFGGAWQPGRDSGGSPHTNMDGRKLILCLNGKTVQCTGNDRLLSSLAAYTSGTAYWAAGLDITITDCQTTGTMKLTSAANTLTQGGLFWMTADNGSLTIYNGTFDASAATAKYDGNAGFVDITNSNRFTMYGGTIKGGTFERVTASKATNGITIYTNASLPMNIYGGTILAGTTETRCGGALYASGSAVVNIGDGVVIKDGHANYAGNIYTTGSVTVNIGAATISGGSANQEGGNFYIEGGTVTLNGTTITGGTAVNNGGSIRLAAGALVINAGTTISGGSVPATGTAWKYGGNIALGGNTTLTMNGGTISGGNTNYGGSIYIGSATFNMKGGTITGGNANRGGGNFFMDGGAKFSMSGGTITKGVASAESAGNILAKGTFFSVTGGTISEGTAAANGGNIYCKNFGDTDTTFGFSNVTISDGKAHSGVGGNLYIESGIVNVTNSTISGGEALAGGNIRTSGTLNLGASASDTTVVTGGRAEAFTTSSTEKMGGNLLVAGGSTTINGATLTAGGSSGNGGNVRVNGTLTMESGTIENSTAGCNVFVNISATFEMKGGTIRNAADVNVAVNGYNSCYNGKFLMSGGTVSQDADHLTRNVNLYGYMKMTGGTLTVSFPSVTTSGSNVMLMDCDSRPAPSGVSDPKQYLAYLEMTGGTMSGGKGPYGGNIYAGKGTTVDISGTSVITGGFATNAGGNIYFENIITMAGGTISDGATTTTNKTDWYIGGNIAGSKLTMTGGTITGGHSNAGGNVYIYGTSAISGGTISNGEALTVYGGNIAMDGSPTLTITGSALITGGKSKLGGNIRVAGTLIVGTIGATETLKITKGVCETPLDDEKKGGNIYIDAGNATINNGTISEGKGGSGGNIRIDNGKTLTLNGGVIENPVAGNNIFINITSEMVMNGGLVKDAPSENICINGYDKCINGRLYLNGGTIEQTKAYRNIGAYGYLKVNGGTIKGGSVGNGNGGAVSLGNATREAPSGVTDIKQYLPYFEMVSGEITGGSGTGGNLYVGKDTTAVISGGIMRNGVMPSSDYSIPNIAVGNGGNLTVTGGTILALESAGDHNENAIWITQGGSASISGGYITRIWARTLTKYVSGGFFYAKPGANYLADGLSAIPGTYANTAYPEDTRTYNYEIAEGVVIEATSGVKLGELGAVASISGGGLKKKNASFTLTAPEMNGFEFLGWFLGTTSLGTGYTYTATADASKTIEAVYDYGPATGFAVTVGGTADYTITGTTVGDKYVSGTEVTVAYTGTDAFEGWINDSGKIVSRDAEYVFTVISDVSLTANTGSAATPIVVFYNASNQVMFTKTVGGANPVADSDFASVPAVVGKKNGRWTVKGTAVTSVDTLLAAAGDSTAIDVIATYDPDDAAVYDLTVVGVELGESGLLSTWTAYAAGDQSFTGINKTATVLLSAPAGAKTFLYYAAEDGTILSMSAETYIRYQESTTIYAVYGDASVQAGPAVTMISAFRDGTTIYFEALRDIPEGYTVKEQGILFGLTEDLTYGASGTYKYVSSGKNAHDVTALTLKNIAAGTTVYGRGYVIFTDGTDEGIIYTVKTPVQ